MSGIFTHIYHQNQANVGKYTSPIDPTGGYELTKPLTYRSYTLQGINISPW